MDSPLENFLWNVKVYATSSMKIRKLCSPSFLLRRKEELPGSLMKMTHEMQHEMESQLIFHFTLGITLCLTKKVISVYRLIIWCEIRLEKKDYLRFIFFSMAIWDWMPFIPKTKVIKLLAPWLPFFNSNYFKNQGMGWQFGDFEEKFDCIKWPARKIIVLWRLERRRNVSWLMKFPTWQLFNHTRFFSSSK